MNHAESVLRLASHFKQKLEDTNVLIDTEAAKKQLTEEEFEKACELYKTNSKNEWYPKNIQCVIDLVRKPIFDEDIAQNIVSKLFEYQIKKGRDWSKGVVAADQKIYFEGLDAKGEPALHYTFEQAMFSVFGLVGIEIVNREAGWVNFCAKTGDFDKTIFRPQMVKLAISLLKHMDKTGSFEVAPLLASNEPVVLNILDFKIKTIQPTKKG